MKSTAICLILLVAAVGIVYPDSAITLKNWKLDGEMERFAPDNLWELINGAADAYISYGFVGLRAFEVVNGALRFMVHIYDMAKPLWAFGIYRSENPPLATALKIGAESQFSDYLAVMLSGRYYVKIESIKGKAVAENCRSLMEEILAQLGGEDRFPDELNLLPRDHLLPQSEQYILEHFLGVTELGNALLGKYQEGEHSYRLFVMPNQDVDAFFADLPPEWKRMTIGKGEAFYLRQIPYIGPVGLSVHQGTLMGIVDVKDEKLLRRIFLEQLARN